MLIRTKAPMKKRAGEGGEMRECGGKETHHSSAHVTHHNVQPHPDGAMKEVGARARYVQARVIGKKWGPDRGVPPVKWRFGFGTTLLGEVFAFGIGGIVMGTRGRGWADEKRSV